MFADKLDFIMNVTDTRNNMLARAVNLDASHISRLRHGGRRLPADQTFLKHMARYFANQVKTDMEKDAMRNVLNIVRWPENPETCAKLIYDWLRSEESSRDPIKTILNKFTQPAEKPAQPSPAPAVPENVSTYYYGAAGKREAVLRFLSAVSSSETPQTLYLFSEEEMSWLYDEPEFAKVWAELLAGALTRGNRIKIIHTVSRNLYELLESVAKWVPVYMTGMIEPYYYPRLRDGIFDHTFFIAPATGAVISSSVSDQTDDMLHFYVQEPAAIQALLKEYDNYLSLCKPLMKIYDQRNIEDFWSVFHEFINIPAETMLIHTGPSLVSMPEDLAERMFSGGRSSMLMDIHHAVSAAFTDQIGRNRLTELLTLQDAAGAVPFLQADIMGTPGLCYSRKEYAEHLSNMLCLCRDHNNYRVLLCSEELPDMLLLGKDGTGIMMIKQSAPYTIFTFNEPNMTAAFWRYMNIKKEAALEHGPDPEKRLKDIIGGK